MKSSLTEYRTRPILYESTSGGASGGERMQTVIKKAIGDESGKVLILALILLVVGGLIMGPLLGFMGTGLVAGQVYERKTSQLYAADAGVEDSINWLVNGQPPGWPWTGDYTLRIWQRTPLLYINENAVRVTVEGLSEEDTYKITSTALEGQRETTVIAVVRAPAKFKGCYVEEGGLALGTNNNTRIDGDLIVVGNVTLNQHSSLAAEGVTIQGDLILEQNTSITAKVICVTGNVRLANHTTINAAIHFLGDDCTLTIPIGASTSVVRGNLLANGKLTIQILSGSAQSVEVEGDVYAPNGAVNVKFDHPNADLKGDIYAHGAVTIDGTTHTGTPNPDYRGDAPFSVPPCPSFDTDPVTIYSYDVT